MLRMRPLQQFFLGTITAFFLGVILFVIVALDDPLRGESGLDPEPLQVLWDRTMVWDEPLVMRGGVMAEFTVREVEGMRQVRIDIRDETVRARRGAMSNMRGDDHAYAAAAGGRRRAAARSSPARRGCGRSTPAPARSCCSRRSAATTCSTWTRARAGSSSRASTGPRRAACELGLFREPFWASLWAGDGFLAWKTTVTGHGRVAINAPGPVETVEVSDGELRVQGRLVLGRTDGPRLHLAALGALPAQPDLRAAAAAGLSAAPARRWSAGRRTGTSTSTS